MLAQRLRLGMKVVLGLLPIYYGAILLASLPDTWLWVLVTALVLISLLVLCVSLSLPLQTIWPIFSGAFLISACLCVLLQGANTQPLLTRQPMEMTVMYVIGALLIAWGTAATWKAYSNY
jgi:hypothetical protein